MYYRKHTRLPGFNYTSSLYYFVTVCTKDRKELFVPRVCNKYGHELVFDVAAASYAANEKIIENTKIVENCINDLENKYYRNLKVDFYCIMEDHVHLILGFEGKVSRIGAIGSRSYSLGQIITSFKSMISRDIGISLWQKNYYEHIIRSEDNLNRIRNYVLQNPEMEYQDIEWLWLDNAKG